MDANTAQPTSEHASSDMVDFRLLLQALLRGWYILAAFILLAALSAFVVSERLLAPEFRASAYVTVRAAVIEPGSAGDWRTIVVRPDVRAVLAMATSDSLVGKYLDDSDVKTALADQAERMTVEEMKNKMSASLDGNDLVQLRVTDANPKLAAVLANRWAQILVYEVNRTYGVTGAYQVLSKALEPAEGEYRKAQAVLETALQENRTAQLQTRLTAATENLACILKKQSVLESAALELRLLEKAWSALPAEQVLSSADAFALFLLQNRVFSNPCQTPGGQVSLQVPADSLVSLTAGQALGESGRLQGLISALLEQARQDEQAQSDEITAINQELESNLARLQELTLARDTKAQLYLNLTERLALFETVFLEGSRVALVSIPASVPQKPLGPSTTLNTLAAALLGAILGAFVVLWRAWRVRPAHKA